MQPKKGYLFSLENSLFGRLRSCFWSDTLFAIPSTYPQLEWDFADLLASFVLFIKCHLAQFKYLIRRV